ncbi:MAG: PEGA domain-containing protein [Kofleriaceae bacterium]
MRTSFVASLAVLAVSAATARGEPKRKVLVETDPPGADVYLNAKEDGSVCKTPCSVEVPVGDTPVIIELENHVPLIQLISVPKRGKPAPARFKLDPAIGTIIVEGPRGATIRIDEVDKGKAPARIDIEAGPHIVALSLGGKQLDSQPIEVEAGAEITVSPPGLAGAGEGEGSLGDGDGDGDGPEISGGDQGDAPRAPRAKFLRISGAFDIGFRAFRYDGIETPGTLPPEEEGGQVLAGPLIEFWPGPLVGIRALRGLSLLVKLQFLLNRQQVTGNGLGGDTTTFWQIFEASVRQRWTIGDAAAVEVGLGYARDQHQFNTTQPADLLLLPEADYQSIRIGLRGSLLLGAFEPYLAGENRLVLSGGALEQRFSRGGSASGLRGAAGVAATFGSIIARVEGSITRYSWTFEFDNNDRFRATGASDSIKLISLAVGYAY